MDDVAVFERGFVDRVPVEARRIGCTIVDELESQFARRVENLGVLSRHGRIRESNVILPPAAASDCDCGLREFEPFAAVRPTSWFQKLVKWIVSALECSKLEFGNTVIRFLRT